ncbi:uncharacterized protein LOC119326656 [Triticum dicoccoides]|uniref:uncharacterized protein LOC119326656 n=1 Tax=Triticum dicoccoides TaxID=85692 RepID=UPI001890E87F|nr:uncharacterized protein LOC119326656 [Triticum dicoccoides]
MLRLRLRWRALSQLLSAPSASPISQLLGYHSRLLSAAAPAVSTNHSFAVEDYLVSTCGLPQAQALKASHKLAHLKSPANPDAVLAFLAGLGLSGADVAALVARDPRFLCAGVGTILAPNVAALTGLGLACSDIAHLLWHAPGKFHRPQYTLLPCASSGPTRISSLLSSANPTFCRPTSTGWSSPLSRSCESLGLVLVILPSCVPLNHGCSPAT